MAPGQRFKLYYECGLDNGVCLAVSADGISFTKPKLRPDGSNMVVSLPHDGTSVHLLLDEPDPSKRFQMTIAPTQTCSTAHDKSERTSSPPIPHICDCSGNGCSTQGAGNGPNGCCLHLKKSADGIHWQTLANKTGENGDRSTGFWNGLRRKFVWSIRPNCIPSGSEAFNAESPRWRGYVEGDSAEASANWDQCFPDSKLPAGISHCQGRTDACTKGRVVSWFGADSHDRPNCSPFASCDHPKAQKKPAENYNVDAVRLGPTPRFTVSLT